MSNIVFQVIASNLFNDFIKICDFKAELVFVEDQLQYFKGSFDDYLLIEKFEPKLISENDALIELLETGILFSNGRQYLDLDGTPQESTTVLFINCNELFLPAADGENIPHSEILNLYLYFKNPLYKGWGVDMWCSIKRNEKPQEKYVNKMKIDGVWNETLENLTNNFYENYNQNNNG